MSISRNNILNVICCASIVVLVGVLAMLCCPIYDLPIPQMIKNSRHVRAFFAYDALGYKQQELTSFDPQHLKDFLKSRSKHKSLNSKSAQDTNEP
jgi:hypothetical protein